MRNCRPRSPRPSATSTSPRCARRSTASSPTAWSRPATSSWSGSGSAMWCRSTKSSSTPTSRRRSSSASVPGQPVTISVDAYGHRKFAGIVDSISPAAGSVFTLLPPDNATGNFTKIVQRLPVRVRVPKDVARQNLLRAGMSVYATVDTTQRRQAMPTARPTSTRRRRSTRNNSASGAAPDRTSPDRADHGRRHHRPAFDDGRRSGAVRAHRAAPAVCVSHHGVRDVHVDPGHPGGLGVAHRHPGRPVGEFDRGIVGADLLSDRRSDRDSAVRIPVARARHPVAVCDFRLRLHHRELPVRICLVDRADDPVARDPGISGRRHDPDRVRVGLYGVSALEILYRRPDHRPGRDAGADHRADGRRHHHRRDVVALAVLHQRRPRHRHHHRRAGAGRFRPAEFRAARPFRLVRPDRDGGISRRARICARGRAAI